MSEIAFADTNLFLRFFTDDVPKQADAVERLLQQAKKGKVTLLANELVIAEVVWVLESSYQLDRETIRKCVVGVLNTPGVKVTSSDLIIQAIDIYVAKNIDFIDAYNTCWMKANSIKVAYTFDYKHFSRVDGIEAKVPQ